MYWLSAGFQDLLHLKGTRIKKKNNNEKQPKNPTMQPLL